MEMEKDWTRGSDGTVNSSPLFEEITTAVAKILLQRSRQLVRGQSQIVALKILSVLTSSPYGLVIPGFSEDQMAAVMNRLSSVVSRTIVDRAYAFIGEGDLDGVARRIVAQLAHVHHLAPAEKPSEE